MSINNIISIIGFILMAVLILINYISVIKPYNYIVVIFTIIPAIIIQTPVADNMSKELELIFGVVYFIINMAILFSYAYTERKKRVE